MVGLLADTLDKGVELLRLAYHKDVVNKDVVLRAFAHVAVCAGHLADKTGQSLREVLNQVLELIIQEELNDV